jgi:HAD superfamily hydrolase (TIGR01509 family)
MDGVLADTERDAHRPAFNKVFDRYHLDTEWTVERYGKLLETGGGKERMTAHWNEVGWPVGFPEDPKERQEKVKELHLRKTAIFNEMIQEGGIPLRPGVLRLIDDAIAANIRLAVCSTSSELAVRNLVNTLMGPERAAKFDIFAGDMVQKKKPSPDVYLMAIDRMGLDKSKCVIVEDSHIGLGAALAAGVSCIVTKSSYTAKEDFTGANMIVEDLGDDPATGVTLETLESLLPTIGSDKDDVALDQVDRSGEIGGEEVEALEELEVVVESTLIEPIQSELEDPPGYHEAGHEETQSGIEGTDDVLSRGIGIVEENVAVKESRSLLENLPGEPSQELWAKQEEPQPVIVQSEQVIQRTPSEQFKDSNESNPSQTMPPLSMPVAAPLELAQPRESTTLTEVGRIVQEIQPRHPKPRYRWKTFVFWSNANLYDQTFGG